MKLFIKQIETNAKTKLMFALCTVLALSAASLRAQEDKDVGAPDAASTPEAGKAGRLNPSDEKFVKGAFLGGLIEMKASKLAVEKAQNEQVKEFAQKMLDSHTAAIAELKQTASNKGVTLSDIEDNISDEDRARVREKLDTDKDVAELKAQWKKLESASGTDFDRQYVSMTTKWHERRVQAFEKVSQGTGDAEVKAFAAKRLPSLQENLTIVKNLQSQVSGMGAPGTDSGTESDKK